MKTGSHAMTYSMPLAVLLALAVATPALAEGDAAAGKQKSVACQACHGADGNAEIDPQYPRLAGQYENYIEQALHEYKAGADTSKGGNKNSLTRDNPIMKGFASTLSEQDIADIAAYFSSLPDTKLTDLAGKVQGD